MFRLRPCSVLALGGCLALAPSAQAGRPLQAEDAGVIEAHGCELEGAHSHWRRGNANDRQTSLQFGCGLGGGVELAVQALHPDEVAALGKFQLWESAAADRAFTVAWSWSHRRVDGAWRSGLLGLTGVWSTPLGPWGQVHFNLGHQHDAQQKQSSTVWALAFEHDGLGPQGRWQPMAEVFGDDRSAPWVNAALRWAWVPDRAFVDASVGRQLSGTRARLTTVGFKFAF